MLCERCKREIIPKIPTKKKFVRYRRGVDVSWDESGFMIGGIKANCNYEAWYKGRRFFSVFDIGEVLCGIDEAIEVEDARVLKIQKYLR